MKKKYIHLLFACCTLFSSVIAQKGKIIRFVTAHSMFPDTARANGHDYNGKHYDAATCYSDSSVLVYVPENFSATGKIHLVYWFHGWNNNIDSACKQYQLIEQFEASGRNAVFVFPEGPENAPDSYGGKLEQPLVFQLLTKEVIRKLVDHRIIKKQHAFRIENYGITLAGHSGAYRVISRIINQNPVQEVILFDALYGGNEFFLPWLSVQKHRFINIYTKDGGTYNNSRWIMHALSDSLHIPLIPVEEEALNDQLLRTHKKIFIFSSQTHNGVITHNQNWERFLRNKPAEK